LRLVEVGVEVGVLDPDAGTENAELLPVKSSLFPYFDKIA